jgi:hypothetical protein
MELEPVTSLFECCDTNTALSLQAAQECALCMANWLLASTLLGCCCECNLQDEYAAAFIGEDRSCVLICIAVMQRSAVTADNSVAVAPAVTMLCCLVQRYRLYCTRLYAVMQLASKRLAGAWPALSSTSWLLWHQPVNHKRGT